MFFCQETDKNNAKKIAYKKKNRQFCTKIIKNLTDKLLILDKEMNYKLEEQDAQKEAPKKLPYNLREKREKEAAYRSMIRADLADELYQKIYDIVIVKKNYKDSNFSSKDLAKMLQTNTRYLSAVVNSRFGMNFSCLLNEYRIKDALRLLADKKNADKNIEEISAMVGFANRQSFYAAFYRIIGETPNGYRKRILSAKVKK